MQTTYLNPKYKPLFGNDTRYFVLTGGRGSAKSFSVAMFILALTYEKGHKILFTRYTMTSARISIIPEFVDKIELMGRNGDFTITKDSIVNKINAVLGMIDQKNYVTAEGKLQNDVLERTNGCTTIGSPDSNDWIMICEGQGRVYPLIIKAQGHLKKLF